MKIVSFFAGCGGLDLGFEQAGFDIIWANEHDKALLETYRVNHPFTNLCDKDIKNVSGIEIPECDGFIGGPPCQSWSEGGKGLGLKDERGRLFLEYVRLIKEKQPSFFLIENVRGILSEKHFQTFLSFLSLLKEAGYKIFYSLLNAADYGIPQDRYRVFIIGLKEYIKKDFKFPDPSDYRKITLYRAIGDICEEPQFYLHNKVDQNYGKRLNHDVYIGSFDAKYMARNRVRSWNDVSFTIQAQARNCPLHPQAPPMIYISPNSRIFAPGYEHLYRRLSVRECARIQTFPDKFRFVYSDIRNGYKMVGNAVPPRLARILGVAIRNLF